MLLLMFALLLILNLVLLLVLMLRLKLVELLLHRLIFKGFGLINRDAGMFCQLLYRAGL